MAAAVEGMKKSSSMGFRMMASESRMSRREYCVWLKTRSLV
jgi:hypothetical protein